MPDSLSLALFHAARDYQLHLGRHVSQALAAGCGERVAPAQMGFLSALICGDNTASDIARRLGISRQAAQKQVADLVARGYLHLSPDPARRNRSLIGFTRRGTALMSACRTILSRHDAGLGGEDQALRRAASVMSGLDASAPGPSVPE